MELSYQSHTALPTQFYPYMVCFKNCFGIYMCLRVNQGKVSNFTSLPGHYYHFIYVLVFGKASARNKQTSSKNLVSVFIFS